MKTHQKKKKIRNRNRFISYIEIFSLNKNGISVLMSNNLKFFGRTFVPILKNGCFTSDIQHQCETHNQQDGLRVAGSSRCTHLSHKVHVCTKHRLEPLSLFEELGHGPVVLPHIFLALLLLVEQFGQVVPEPQVHLKAPQFAVKPTVRTREGHLSLRSTILKTWFGGFKIN